LPDGVKTNAAGVEQLLLPPENYALWLNHSAPLKEAHALLKPYPAELMAVSEASALVNSPKNEGPQLLDPAA
jgi:putative SOS response-associated peptidase YedK